MHMSRYVRLTKGVADKGILIKPEDVYGYVDDKSDYYVSTYYYNDNHLKRFKETGSVKGIKDVTTDKLWFDFDNKEDPEFARQDSIELVNRLRKYGIKDQNIEVYFSGNKGFNVIVTLNRTLTPDLCYSLAVNKFGKGLKTLDTTLYDATQILRVPGSKHQVSGLHKFPLTINQLNSLTTPEVKSMAVSIDNAEEFDWTVATPDSKFYEVEVPKKEATNKSDYKLDLTQKPRQWKNCKWSLLQGNFKSGERHQALLILAATLRGLGYDKETTYYMCKSALKKQATLSGQEEFPKEELWENIIEQSVYTDGWEGGQYSCKKDGWLKGYCQSLGEHKCEEEKDDNPITLVEVRDSFKEYVMNIDKNTIYTGIPSIDKNVFISTGANVGIIGAAGSGKSSIALNILNNTSKAGVRSVFASLDMHRNRMFEKVMYKISGLTRDELYHAFQNNEEAPYIEKMKQEFGNVNFYNKSCPNVSDIKDYIVRCQDHTGEKVKLVMLDYFERVSSDYSDDTQASKRVAGELQDLVNDLDIALITLVQPNKFSLSGGPDSPIYDYTSIKGSSFVYQAFRIIMSLWRPFYNPKDFSNDRYMQMAVLKNDLGELAEFGLSWNGRLGQLSELEDWQQEELEELLQKKEEKKSNKNDDGWK